MLFRDNALSVYTLPELTGSHWMNVEVSRRRETSPGEAQSRLAIADCDLHLGPRSLDDLQPPCRRGSSSTSRPMAWPPYRLAGWRAGVSRIERRMPRGVTRFRRRRRPGTDLEFTRRQHLDPFQAARAGQPAVAAQNFMNPDLGNAMCRARQRLADQSGWCARATATRLHRGAASRIRWRRWRRSSAAPATPARSSCDEPDRPSRWAAPLLADLTRAAAYGLPSRCTRSASTATRHRRQAGRPSTSRTCRARPGLPGASHQPGDRGRIRALPDAPFVWSRAASAGFPRCAGGWTLWRRLGDEVTALEAAAVGVHPRARLADHAAGGGAARPREHLLDVDEWSGTGSCSRATTRTGTRRPTQTLPRLERRGGAGVPRQRIRADGTDCGCSSTARCSTTRRCGPVAAMPGLPLGAFRRCCLAGGASCCAARAIRRCGAIALIASQVACCTCRPACFLGWPPTKVPVIG